MGFFDDLFGSNKNKGTTLTHHTLGDGWTSDANIALNNTDAETKWYNDIASEFNDSLDTLINHEDTAYEWWQDIYWADNILHRILNKLEFGNKNEQVAINNINSLNETINGNIHTIRQNDDIWIKNKKIIDIDHWVRNHQYNKTNDDCKDKIEQYQCYINQWNIIKDHLRELIPKIINFKNKALERYYALTNKEYEEKDFIDQYNAEIEKEEQEEKRKQAEREEQERIAAANRRPISELFDQMKKAEDELHGRNEPKLSQGEILMRELAEAAKAGNKRKQKKIWKKIHKLSKI